MRSVHLAAAVLCILLSACSSKTAAPHSEGGAAGAEGAPKAPTQAPSNARFERTLELQGIAFKVSCANASTVNHLTIVPSGLEISNDPIAAEVAGTVTGAEVADLNADGSPEIYVYLRSADAGAHGKLVAYSANRRKSLSEIYLPPIADNPEASQGYTGHDEFAVVERTLVQRFATPSGKTRQLQYELIPGEAGWRLKLKKTIEF